MYWIHSVGIRIRFKQPDPDWYQNEKQDPDPYQNSLDPQHWTKRPETLSPGTTHPAGQNTWTDKTSGRQNVRGDKTSGDIKSVGQNIHGDNTSGGTKHPETQRPISHILISILG
jgi:hypothetical protein